MVFDSLIIISQIELESLLLCITSVGFTLFHTVVDTSNSQASFNALYSALIPPSINRCGYLLLKPRQQAAWDARPSGFSSLSSLH